VQLICEPQGYVQMKESTQCPKAYEKFRRLSALGRARSFTFGDGSSNDPLAGAQLTMDAPAPAAAIKEEEHENSMERSTGNTSGDTSSPGGAGDSPCPVALSVLMRQKQSKGLSLPTRTMQRAATETVLDFGGRRAVSDRQRNPFDM
jgi:hypothetical protein